MSPGEGDQEGLGFLRKISSIETRIFESKGSLYAYARLPEEVMIDQSPSKQPFWLAQVGALLDYAAGRAAVSGSSQVD